MIDDDRLLQPRHRKASYLQRHFDTMTWLVLTPRFVAAQRVQQLEAKLEEFKCKEIQAIARAALLDEALHQARIYRLQPPARPSPPEAEVSLSTRDNLINEVLAFARGVLIPSASSEHEAAAAVTKLDIAELLQGDDSFDSTEQDEYQGLIEAALLDDDSDDTH